MKKPSLKMLHGMLVRLELKKTVHDSDYHTVLTRIKVDGDKAACRCVVCGCHRLTLTPKLIDYLLSVIAVSSTIPTEPITIKDGSYGPKDRADEGDHVAHCLDLFR
jgi:hypothetical protein